MCRGRVRTKVMSSAMSAGRIIPWSWSLPSVRPRPSSIAKFRLRRLRRLPRPRVVAQASAGHACGRGRSCSSSRRYRRHLVGTNRRPFTTGLPHGDSPGRSHLRRPAVRGQWAATPYCGGQPRTLRRSFVASRQSRPDRHLPPSASRPLRTEVRVSAGSFGCVNLKWPQDDVSTHESRSYRAAQVEHRSDPVPITRDSLRSL
jgi:hypothetical protein